MKKNFYILGGVVLLIFILIGRAFYVELILKSGDWTTTMTPDESKNESLFIRTLTFNPVEIYYDITYDII